MSVSLHNYNFEHNLFSGDARQAHQFIPFLQSKLGEAKLSYILKADAIPQPDECLLILERLHKGALQEAARVYEHRQREYTTRLVPIYQHHIVHLMRDEAYQALTPEQQRARTDAIPVPAPPLLDLPQTQFSPAMEIQLSKARERIRHTESDADAAIQLIKRYLSVRILNSCAHALNDSTHSSHQKLLVIWAWLCNQRIYDAQIISNIRQDMNQLPDITNFDEALITIGQLNLLQAELYTLAQPMTDLELIITHVNKYSISPRHSEQFIPLRLKYLQNPNNHLADLPPSFDAQPVTNARPAPYTWSQYSQDVAQYARAHNSVPRTSTALSVTAPSPDRTNADRRVQRQNKWDKSSSPDLAHRDNRRDGGSAGRNSEYSQFRDRSRSRERELSQTRPYSRDRSHSNRSGSRDRSAASSSDDRSKPLRSTRDQLASKEQRKFLPPEEYRRFQESLRSAHESVVKQFFPSGSSSKRAYTAQDKELEDHDESAVSESEYRALIAAALGDNFDDREDGNYDK